MSYKLTKLSIKEGCTSRVSVGESATADEIRVIRYMTPAEIKIGDEIYVGRGLTSFLKTSPVEIIDKVDSRTTTIRTQTSTYRLEEILTERDD